MIDVCCQWWCDSISRNLDLDKVSSLLILTYQSIRQRCWSSLHMASSVVLDLGGDQSRSATAPANGKSRGTTLVCKTFKYFIKPCTLLLYSLFTANFWGNKRVPGLFSLPFLRKFPSDCTKYQSWKNSIRSTFSQNLFYVILVS